MSAQDVAVLARPAYRDANVLRWLTAYTASVAGDVVFFLALSWAATRAGAPSRVGWWSRRGPSPVRSSGSAAVWWPTGSGRAGLPSSATGSAAW